MRVLKASRRLLDSHEALFARPSQALVDRPGRRCFAAGLGKMPSELIADLVEQSVSFPLLSFVYDHQDDVRERESTLILGLVYFGSEILLIGLCQSAAAGQAGT